ncbi:hypothetical protein [Leucobacter sp. W1038]|uniref:hypothetical protein n=1 Tax=Leucobacter sp. W1038 TaxID=3438281 RepID=UPI003D95D981
MNENSQSGTQDHDSDPAHTPDQGWGEEGGASHLGPATHIQSGQPGDVDVADDEEDADEDEEE